MLYAARGDFSDMSMESTMLQIREMRNFGETTLPLIGRQWTEKKVRKDSHTGLKT
jgi:hypothetical protein